MNNTPSKTEFDLLRDAAFDDLDATSDAQLLCELQEDGFDANSLAREMKQAMHDAVSAALRTKMTIARSAVQAKSKKSSPARIRPALEALKKIVQDTLRANPGVGLAFRNGTRQTDEDYITLYDDLMETGAIERGEDGV